MQNLCDIVPTTSISIFAKIRRPLYVSACSFSSKGKSLKDKIREQLEIQKEGLREKVHMQFKIQKEHLKGKIHEQLEVRKKHLRENVMTIPNCLCFLRIGLTPAIGYFVISEYFFIAFSLFIAAGATDLLDGYIARNMRGQSSLVGSVLDPIADKFLISTLFITLTYVHLVPLQLTSIVILRDIALIIGGFILRYKTLEPPFTIKRFFNPSVSPVEVAPTLVSKVNTVLQSSVVAGSLAAPVFGFVGHPGLTMLCLMTGATTIYSGVQYAQCDRMKRVD